MDRTASFALALLGVLVTSAPAEDRLAVLEFFGRPGGAYCQAAAPAMIALQAEMAGRALLLEYDYDQFPSGRVGRWWAAYPGGPGSVYLPVVMVGSGFEIASGPVDYLERYRDMLEAELARPAEAAAAAYWRRVGSALRVYVRVENRGDVAVLPEQDPSIWVLVWLEGRVGLSDTWVLAAVQHPLSAPLEPGAATTATVDTAPLGGVDWDLVRSLALLEQRPDGLTRYDMLQASLSLPAALQASPGEVALGPAQPTAAFELAGPHVLDWTATSDRPWLEVNPAVGGLPATVVVALRRGAAPPGPDVARVTFTASGDGLSSTATVTVTVNQLPGRATRRIQDRLASPP
jgi:hypothetical protein